MQYILHRRSEAPSARSYTLGPKIYPSPLHSKKQTSKHHRPSATAPPPIVPLLSHSSASISTISYLQDENRDMITQVFTCLLTYASPATPWDRLRLPPQVTGDDFGQSGHGGRVSVKMRGPVSSQRWVYRAARTTCPLTFSHLAYVYFQPGSKLMWPQGTAGQAHKTSLSLSRSQPETCADLAM